MGASRQASVPLPATSSSHHRQDAQDEPAPFVNKRRTKSLSGKSLSGKSIRSMRSLGSLGSLRSTTGRPGRYAAFEGSVDDLGAFEDGTSVSD